MTLHPLSLPLDPSPQLHDFDLEEMEALCPVTLQILRGVPRIYRWVWKGFGVLSWMGDLILVWSGFEIGLEL